MVQFRRLDPLANAGPYQRLLKTAVKSFTLTEAQYNRVRERRPELIVEVSDCAVVGRPYRDVLEVHYGFPEVADFREGFGILFTRCTEASSREEAPRGVVVHFRDRPNRALADTVFWSTALETGSEWVEMNWVAVPEQEAPGDDLGNGFSIREASTSDDGAIVADIEAEITGLPRLTAAGIASLFENARTLRLVRDASGAPVAVLALRTEPGGWGVIDLSLARESVREQLRGPLLDWSVAWLRNNQGRRIRQRVYLEEPNQLTLLRDRGFTPGETGLDYTRPVDAADVKSQIEERQGHGTLIKFGDWR